MEHYTPLTCYICGEEESANALLMTENPCLCSGSLKIHWSCYSELYNHDDTCRTCKTQYSVFPLTSNDFIIDVFVRRSYNPKGKLIEECPIKYDNSNNDDVILHGHYKRYDPLNGHVIKEGPYENGKKSGTWIKRYKVNEYFSHTVKVAYANGQKNGPYKSYDEEGYYKDNLKEGLWIKKNQFTTEEIHYAAGKKHGLYKITNKYNEQLEKKGHYADDLEEGEWKTYYDNGSLKSQGTYVKGQYHGLWKTYHENGSLESQANYVNGQCHGQYTRYKKYDGKVKPHGHKMSEGTFVDGKQHGTWSYYDARSGSLKKKITYENGIEVEQIETVSGKRGRSDTSDESPAAKRSKK